MSKKPKRARPRNKDKRVQMGCKVKAENRRKMRLLAVRDDVGIGSKWDEAAEAMK